MPEELEGVSDQDKLLMRIDSADILAFLTEKNAADCPACKTRAWGLLSPTEHGTFNLPVTKVANFYGDDPHVTCTPLICVNCGFVRIQSLQAIQDWLDERKDAQ